MVRVRSSNPEENLIRIFRYFALVAGCGMLLACAEIPNEPEVPLMTDSMPAPVNASELFIVIRPFVVSPDRLGKWVVLIDGAARAVLPNTTAYTRVLVSPGTHEVLVGLRMRSAALAPALPVPISVRFERDIRVSIPCVPRGRCGVVVDEHAPTAWVGTTLSARILTPDQIDDAVRGLSLKDSDR
jgi:hypothetical protein